jgi:hypothetical protein
MGACWCCFAGSFGKHVTQFWHASTCFLWLTMAYIGCVLALHVQLKLARVIQWLCQITGFGPCQVDSRLAAGAAYALSDHRIQ